jgi:hypothetical protein
MRRPIDDTCYTYRNKFNEERREYQEGMYAHSLICISYRTYKIDYYSLFISFHTTDWSIIVCFTSHSRIFHLYGHVTITGEGLQNLGLSLALSAFEQGGIFIVPHLLWHWASVFPVSSELWPHSVAFYDTQGNADDLF